MVSNGKRCCKQRKHPNVPIGELAYPYGTIVHPDRKCKGRAIGVATPFDGFLTLTSDYSLGGRD